MPLLVLAVLGLLGFLVASVVVAWSAYRRVGQLEERITILTQRVQALERQSPAASPAILPRPAAPITVASPDSAAPTRALPGAAPGASPASTAVPSSPAPGAAARAAEPTSPWTPSPGPLATAPSAGSAGVPDWAAIEAMIGKRWMTWVGALVVFIAGAFFVHHAVTHGLIGPLGRMLLGLAAGIGVGVTGDRALRHGHRALGQGLVGLGLGLLYASWYSGFALGETPILGQGAAFAGMIVATAVGVALSLAHDARAIAILATLGGLLTPVLVSDGSGSREGLFAYLLLLDGGVVALAFAKRWRALDLLAFAGTALLAAAWWGVHGAAAREGATVAWILAFAALFLLLPLAFHLRGREPIGGASLRLVLANAGLATLALWLSQGEARPGPCAALIVALAAPHAAVAWRAPRLFAQGAAARSAFAGIAAALVAVAVPVAWGGEAVTWSWAAQATLLAWLGARLGDPSLRSYGYVVAAACALRTLVLHLPGERAPALPLLNLAFAHAAAGPLLLLSLAALVRRVADRGPGETWLARWGAGVAGVWLAIIGGLDVRAHAREAALAEATSAARVACWHLALAAVFASACRRAPAAGRLVPAAVLALMTALTVLVGYARPLAEVPPLATLRCAVGLALLAGTVLWGCRAEPPLGRAILIGAGVWAWALLSCETWTATAAAAGDRTALLALSLAWIAYAVAVLAVGFRRGLRPVRFAALALLGLTMLKLVLVDLAHLRDLQRIASFAITGVVLIAASWVYHRLERRFGGTPPG